MIPVITMINNNVATTTTTSAKQKIAFTQRFRLDSQRAEARSTAVDLDRPSIDKFVVVIVIVTAVAVVVVMFLLLLIDAVVVVN